MSKPSSDTSKDAGSGPAFTDQSQSESDEAQIGEIDGPEPKAQVSAPMTTAVSAVSMSVSMPPAVPVPTNPNVRAAREDIVVAYNKGAVPCVDGVLWYKLPEKRRTLFLFHARERAVECGGGNHIGLSGCGDEACPPKKTSQTLAISPLSLSEERKTFLKGSYDGVGDCLYCGDNAITGILDDNDAISNLVECKMCGKDFHLKCCIERNLAGIPTKNKKSGVFCAYCSEIRLYCMYCKLPFFTVIGPPPSPCATCGRRFHFRCAGYSQYVTPAFCPLCNMNMHERPKKPDAPAAPVISDGIPRRVVEWDPSRWQVASVDSICEANPILARLEGVDVRGKILEQGYSIPSSGNISAAASGGFGSFARMRHSKSVSGYLNMNMSMGASASRRQRRAAFDGARSAMQQAKFEEEGKVGAGVDDDSSDSENDSEGDDIDGSAGHGEGDSYTRSHTHKNAPGDLVYVGTGTLPVVFIAEKGLGDENEKKKRKKKRKEVEESKRRRRMDVMGIDMVSDLKLENNDDLFVPARRNRIVENDLDRLFEEGIQNAIAYNSQLEKERNSRPSSYVDPHTRVKFTRGKMDGGKTRKRPDEWAVIKYDAPPRPDMFLYASKGFVPTGVIRCPPQMELYKVYGSADGVPASLTELQSAVKALDREYYIHNSADDGVDRLHVTDDLFDPGEIPEIEEEKEEKEGEEKEEEEEEEEKEEEKEEEEKEEVRRSRRIRSNAEETSKNVPTVSTDKKKKRGRGRPRKYPVES